MRDGIRRSISKQLHGGVAWDRPGVGESDSQGCSACREVCRPGADDYVELRLHGGSAGKRGAEDKRPEPAALGLRGQPEVDVEDAGGFEVEGLDSAESNDAATVVVCARTLNPGRPPRLGRQHGPVAEPVVDPVCQERGEERSRVLEVGMCLAGVMGVDPGIRVDPVQTRCVVDPDVAEQYALWQVNVAPGRRRTLSRSCCFIAGWDAASFS